MISGWTGMRALWVPALGLIANKMINPWGGFASRGFFNGNFARCLGRGGCTSFQAARGKE